MDAKTRELERRIAALEAAVFPDEAVVAEAAPVAAPISPASSEAAPVVDTRPRLHYASLIGRLFIGLAGAFLLRAAVDDGVLAPGMGFALGLAYAAGWLVWADRCRRVAGSRRGLVHGLLAALIAYPLLWESGAAKGHVDPAIALACAGLVTVAFVFVADRLERQVLAGVAVGGAMVVGSAIYWGTDAKAAACLLLIITSALGAASWYGRRWPAPAWLAAPWANIVLLLPLLHAAGSPERTEGGYPAAAVVLLLAGGQFVLAVGMFSRTMLSMRRSVGPFGILQTLTTMGLAFGAAKVAARSGDTAAMAIGAGALAAGAAMYAFSFAGVQRTHGKGAEFYYHSTLAVLLVLTGAAFLPAGGWVGALWMGLALVLSLLGARRSRLTLRYHGAAITLASILATGVLTASLPALSSTDAAPLLELHRLVVTAMVFVCGWVLASTALPVDAAWTRRLPTAVVFGASALLGLGLLAQVAGRIGGWADAGDPGLIAVVRTLAGCLTAVLLMAMVRILKRPEPGWLVMPLLFALGAKVILEDLGAGSSGLRFIGFLAYGATWIGAARTVRFTRKAVEEQEPLAAAEAAMD